MNATKLQPAWIADSKNAKKFKSVSVLYCGPHQAMLTEHSHPESQLSVRLPASPASRHSQTQISLYPCHQPHGGGWSSGVEVVTFHFAPDILQDFSETMSRSKTELIPKHNFRDSVIEGLAVLCSNEHHSPHALSSLYIESAAHMLLRHVIRSYSSASTTCGAPEGLSARELSRLTGFIEENMNIGFTVAELAAWMQTSPNQLGQRLRFSTGLSIWRFVQRQRVAMAKMLLMSQTLTIAHIAMQLGYFDQSHFTKAFRDSVGVTPGEFRK
jgi:AraC family transcriptional regulator